MLLIKRQIWLEPIVQGKSEIVHITLVAVEGKQAIVDGNVVPMNIYIVQHESSIVKWPKILLILWYRTHDIIE
jgi:hypothetical protein